jgi:hypothetical protein
VHEDVVTSSIVTSRHNKLVKIQLPVVAPIHASLLAPLELQLAATPATHPLFQKQALVYIDAQT